MIQPCKHDWAKIVAEIKAKTCASNYKLGAMMNRHHTIVESWLNGSVPKHPDGELLLALHRQYVGESSPTTSTLTTT